MEQKQADFEKYLEYAHELNEYLQTEHKTLITSVNNIKLKIETFKDLESQVEAAEYADALNVLNLMAFHLMTQRIF